MLPKMEHYSICDTCLHDKMDCVCVCVECLETRDWCECEDPEFQEEE